MDKKKVISFIEDKSLDKEDELCRGNGYWFYIREKKLLDDYIYGNAVQSFNPVSEAEVVLANASSKKKKKKKTSSSSQSSSKDDVSHFPDEEDLAYPDEGDSR